MRISAIDAARKFVQDKFPNCFTALLAGSASRGEETDTFDLDIVIFDNTVPNRYRESSVHYGWRIECFIHNETSYMDQFAFDSRNGRATLATMISTGIILKYSGETKTLIETADQWVSAGPPSLDEGFINTSRYFIYDLLDDFKDSKSDEEAIIIVNTLSIQLAEFILHLNGQWSARGKSLARHLYKFDKNIADRYFESLKAFYQRGEKQPLSDFVDTIYAPLGGQLFDGFKQE